MPGPDDLRNILRMLAEGMQSGRIGFNEGAQEMLRRAHEFGMSPEDIGRLREALDAQIGARMRAASPPPGQALPSPSTSLRPSGVESLDELLGRRVISETVDPVSPSGQVLPSPPPPQDYVSAQSANISGPGAGEESVQQAAEAWGIRPGSPGAGGESWHSLFPEESVKTIDIPGDDGTRRAINIDMPLEEQATLLETLMGEQGLKPTDWHGTKKTGFFSPKQLNPISHFPFFGKGGAFRGGRTSSSGFHTRQPKSARLLGIPLPTSLMREKVPNTPLMESLISRHRKVQDEIIRSKKMEKRLKKRLFRRAVAPPVDPTSQVRYPSLLEVLEGGP